MSKGTLYTTFISNLKYCDTSNAKVLIITRYLKDELKDSLQKEYGAIHVEDLSPSPTLLWDYKEGRINWFQYTLEFLVQILTYSRSLACLRRIADLLNEGINVYLVCYENLKKGKPCHRSIVANIFQSAGYDCEEIFI